MKPMRKFNVYDLENGKVFNDLFEKSRIEYLHNLNILDTDFDINFDRIAELLKESLNIPIVLISFIDYERQWFKSCIGLNVREISREGSFCSNAIKESDIYIINDTSIHPLYKTNEFVIGHPNIKFYAGMFHKQK